MHSKTIASDLRGKQMQPGIEELVTWASRRVGATAAHRRTADLGFRRFRKSGIHWDTKGFGNDATCSTTIDVGFWGQAAEGEERSSSAAADKSGIGVIKTERRATERRCRAVGRRIAIGLSQDLHGQDIDGSVVCGAVRDLRRLASRDLRRLASMVQSCVAQSGGVRQPGCGALL